MDERSPIRAFGPDVGNEAAYRAVVEALAGAPGERPELLVDGRPVQLPEAAWSVLLHAVERFAEGRVAAFEVLPSTWPAPR